MPSLSAAVVKVTCPLLFTAFDACNTDAPSLKMTPPLVIAALLVRFTLAVNVTLLPVNEGLCDETTVVRDGSVVTPVVMFNVQPPLIDPPGVLGISSTT